MLPKGTKSDIRSGFKSGTINATKTGKKVVTMWHHRGTKSHIKCHIKSCIKHGKKDTKYVKKTIIKSNLPKAVQKVVQKCYQVSGIKKVPKLASKVVP